MKEELAKYILQKDCAISLVIHLVYQPTACPLLPFITTCGLDLLHTVHTMKKARTLQLALALGYRQR
jgi:hypothetical protein